MITSILIKKPSNEREWAKDQNILSHVEFNNELITIYNIRNATYKNTSDYDLSYYNKTFNLNEIKRLDYLLEHFGSFEGIAHTMLTFGFENDEYISISIEIRKEKGEEYSPLKGLFRAYEIMYVIGDEKDLINLRTNYRNDSTYLYPINISKESLKQLFVLMLNRTNELSNNPEFYNTLTSTCTTNLAKASSKTTQKSFSQLHYKVLLPGYSDSLLLDRDTILTNLKTTEEIRNKFKINKIARVHQYSDSKTFSKAIRNLK